MIGSARNQPPPLEGYDVFRTNRPLVEALRREGGGAWEDDVSALGVELGGEPLEWGRLANVNPPSLRSHDRYGERLDEVEFHSSWHSLMALGIRHGLHALSWRVNRPGAHVARAAMFVTYSQVEQGSGCPISMTHAAVPALRAEPELAAEWEPRLLSLSYDPRLLPSAEKVSALCGMAMTERQGGSDVRANDSTARPIDGKGEYRLTGHKWFCSAPMCDAFLVLAYAPGGLSCFLLPRVLPDGTRNEFRLQRLKDKLGNRSNASAELEFLNAWARLVGEEGAGVRTIIEMVNYTRLDCVLGSTAIMRRAVAEAIHHASHRSAFDRLLVEQPVMLNVLADLSIESEAASAASLRIARAYDEGDSAFRRLATAVAKYWVCKRAPEHVAEALECIGGNGYVEESVLPRLYREAPVNSIWEGPGNIQCLDVLRALRREPESIDAFFAEVEIAAGVDRRLDAALATLHEELAEAEDAELRARGIVERLATCLQASLLVRHAPHEVADAFCATRLGGEGGRAYGTLPRGIDCAALVKRNKPL